ncbi:T6SS immunity protein Tli4 family protein [Variovorax sp. dw_308]|uniref:T6SS immunity protein Tli4 family protein n=1 Tax=Variovorax sp. dw_308 TaxID=2721546 RepID=UPI001C45DAE5|nr:T6SS immunity protein Tli4 family protein [Variovorax sp. dw_308]
MKTRSATHRKAVFSLCLLVLLSACHLKSQESKTEKMTTLSPRLQSLFSKTKTVCFGRFMIDIPEESEVIWGKASIPLGVVVYSREFAMLNQFVSEQEAKLKGARRFPRNENFNQFIETIDGKVKNQKTIVGYQDFSGPNLRIFSYFPLETDLVEVSALPLDTEKADTILDINDLADRLRPRKESDLPGEPGTCIGHAYLPDSPIAENKPKSIEHIRLGFRSKQFPDVHLSIYTAGANSHDPQSDSLERQLERTESQASLSGQSNPFSVLKVLRRGPRQIHDWTTGYEFLTRTPDEKVSRAHQDFWLKFTGEPNDALRPYADIQLKTGVYQDAAGKVNSSLTDEEAIALWDKLTSSIRVRPVSSTAKKTSDANPRRPLGELAATGRTCPQTGIWQCDDDGNIQNGRRRHFNAGEVMPGIVRAGEQSFLQKLKGEQATYRTGTVWRLVDYEEGGGKS